MDLETIRAKMLAQVDEARASAMGRTFSWRFEVVGLSVYVTLRRRADANREYVLRAHRDDFPQRAPSYVFVETVTKEDVESAWPPGVAHSRSKICTPGTREFHEDLHKTDAQHPWDPTKYTFLNTVRMIHRLMD